jgi:intracellular septation protein
MKMLLDFAPLPLFFIAYQFGGIYVATGTLIVSLYLALAIDRMMTGKLNRVLAGTALLATVLGGLTFALHDPAFIKLKPTIIYALFALACFGSQFFGEQVLMQRLMQSAIQLPAPAWRRLNMAWALFFIFCAALNYYVAHQYAEEVWVRFKLIGLTVLPFVFALLQAPFLLKHMPEEKAPEAPSDPAPKA